MATATQTATLTVKWQPDDNAFLARIVTDHGAQEKVIKPSRSARPGWHLDRAIRFSRDNGWFFAYGSSWYLADGAETRRLERRVELCPNGQIPDECSEIDPCEACWQDQQAEGDMIEQSMGV